MLYFHTKSTYSYIDSSIFTNLTQQIEISSWSSQAQINRISRWGRKWMFWAQKHNDRNNHLTSSKRMEDYLTISMCTDRPTSIQKKRCLGRWMMRWLGKVQKLEWTTIIQMTTVVIMIMITVIHTCHVIWITPATPLHCIMIIHKHDPSAAQYGTWWQYCQQRVWEEWDWGGRSNLQNSNVHKCCITSRDLSTQSKSPTVNGKLLFPPHKFVSPPCWHY